MSLKMQFLYVHCTVHVYRILVSLVLYVVYLKIFIIMCISHYMLYVR